MKNIYDKIANEYSVSPEEVEREILFALTEARKTTSTTARTFWENTDENVPIEEIIRKIVSRIALVV